MTSFTRGVSNYAWADADTIIFAAQEEPSLYESSIKEKKDSSMLVEDEQHARRYAVQFAVKAHKLTRRHNASRIQSFALSPDGAKAVTIHDRSLRLSSPGQAVAFLYDLKSGERKQILRLEAQSRRNARGT